NLIATVAAPSLLFAVPGPVIDRLMVVSGDAGEYRLLGIGLSLLFLLSHRDAFSTRAGKPNMTTNEEGGTS
ncbi:MAG: hypothetical protein WD295_06275, partial [Bacteroidota bacterium]